MLDIDAEYFRINGSMNRHLIDLGLQRGNIGLGFGHGSFGNFDIFLGEAGDGLIIGKPGLLKRMGRNNQCISRLIESALRRETVCSKLLDTVIGLLRQFFVRLGTGHSGFQLVDDLRTRSGIDTGQFRFRYRLGSFS